MEKNLGKRYTEEFKKMIVELYIQGKTKKCLSQEYRVSSNTIREWLKREKKEIKEKNKDETSYLEIVKLKKLLEEKDREYRRNWVI
ncbi:transposase [Sebaldella termitidis]|uniref:transposase n=1 Tax=Sebaldella termitidis TaxID=826 RepID=UPI003EBED583